MKLNVEVGMIIFQCIAKEYNIHGETVKGYSVLGSCGDEGGTVKCTEDVYNQLTDLKDTMKPVTVTMSIDTDAESKSRITAYRLNTAVENPFTSGSSLNAEKGKEVKPVK